MSDYLTNALRAGMPTAGELQLRVDSPYMRHRMSQNVIDNRTGVPYDPESRFAHVFGADGRSVTAQGVSPRDALERLNGPALPPAPDLYTRLQSQTPVRPLFGPEDWAVALPDPQGQMRPVARRKPRPRP